LIGNYFLYSFRNMTLIFQNSIGKYGRNAKIMHAFKPPYPPPPPPPPKKKKKLTLAAITESSPSWSFPMMTPFLLSYDKCKDIISYRSHKELHNILVKVKRSLVYITSNSALKFCRNF
jgi:hypothetical protein